MFSYKTGMVLKSSKKDNYYGEIKVCDIGFYQEQFINFNRNIPNLQTQNLSHKLNYNDFRKILPLRDNITSKFSFGKVAILAGCKEMSGAGVITANSAITMGGGLVYLITDIDSNDTKLYPEVIKNEINFNELNLLSQFEIDKVADNIIEKYKNVNTWIIGPGIGTEQGILNLVTLLVEKLLKLNKFVVLDADGLKVINIEKQYTKNLILTPHLYEYTKLAKLDLEFVQKSLEENPIEFVNNFSKKLNCVIHLKYFPSITTFGNETYLNNNYNSGLSKAGSGDMLSGLVGSLISQTKYKENSQSNDIAEDSVTHIVALASALQSYLADTYTQKYNKESMRASDLIELIKELH
jgi:NAD(P)H-hydrate epimerase